MAFTKITNTELNSRGATTLPDAPTIPANQLKEEFDAPAKQIVAPKVNNLIDELEATTAAASLGMVAPTGRTGSTVKAVVDDISSDLAAVESNQTTDEGRITNLESDTHTHANKELLDTYDQTNSDIKDAVDKRHTHSNKALLDTYTQTESNLADAVSRKHSHDNKALLDTYTQTEANLADAVSKKHEHSNKSLLDTYTQTETDLADAVTKKHSHSNKALLDTYTQTESDLASAVSHDHTHDNKALLDTYTQTESDLSDAVSKKHSHTNKSVLDKFTESGGNVLYDTVKLLTSALSKIKVGNDTLTASGEDTFEFEAGQGMSIIVDATNKKITFVSTGGQGGGDMLKSIYDTNNDGVVNSADTLYGLTATVSELNILDGVTASAAELNVLDGVTGISATVTSGDTNPVSGGAVYTYIDTMITQALTASY